MIILRTGLGVGDVLLATGVLQAYRRQHHDRIIVETKYPELFANNPHAWRVWREGRIVKTLQTTFNRPVVWRFGNALLNYFDRISTPLPYPFPCRDQHLIDGMAASAGVAFLSEERRPFLYLTEQELAEQSWAAGWIAVQSSSTNYWTVNKHWVPGRMQQVADELNRNGYSLVHLGNGDDEPLTAVRDMRGKTSLREAAAILANVRLFVGMEGGLVHLARAVDTRSVAIYTGYTRPEETGYADNINLRDPLAGTGCWRREQCEHCLQSADNLTVAMAMEGIQVVL